MTKHLGGLRLQTRSSKEDPTLEARLVESLEHRRFQLNPKDFTHALSVYDDRTSLPMGGGRRLKNAIAVDVFV